MLQVKLPRDRFKEFSILLHLLFNRPSSKLVSSTTLLPSITSENCPRIQSSEQTPKRSTPLSQKTATTQPNSNPPRPNHLSQLTSTRPNQPTPSMSSKTEVATKATKARGNVKDGESTSTRKEDAMRVSGGTTSCVEGENSSTNQGRLHIKAT